MIPNNPFVDKANALLEDWNLCKNAKPKGDAVNLLSDRDVLERWAYNLQWNTLWGAHPTELAEICYQFEHRLNNYKDKIVIEILHHGAI